MGFLTISGGTMLIDSMLEAKFGEDPKTPLSLELIRIFFPWALYNVIS